MIELLIYGFSVLGMLVGLLYCLYILFGGRVQFKLQLNNPLKKMKYNNDLSKKDEEYIQPIQPGRKVAHGIKSFSSKTKRSPKPQTPKRIIK